MLHLVRLSDAGLYSVRVTNEFGTAQSEPATLNVVPVRLDIAGQVDIWIPWWPELTLRGLNGVYEIQATDDPGRSETWTMLDTIQVSSMPYVWTDVAYTDAARRFYRALLLTELP